MKFKAVNKEKLDIGGFIVIPGEEYVCMNPDMIHIFDDRKVFEVIDDTPVPKKDVKEDCPQGCPKKKKQVVKKVKKDGE